MATDINPRANATDSGSRRDLLRAALGTAIVAGGASAMAVDARCRPDRIDGPAGTGGVVGQVMLVGAWTTFASVIVPTGIDLIQTAGYAVAGKGAARYAVDSDQIDRDPTRFRRRSANGRWFRIAEEAIGYTMAGAVGDGVGGVNSDGTVIPAGGADDTAAVQALYDHLAAHGGGTALVERGQFNVATIRIRGGRIRTVGLGGESRVHTTAATGRHGVFVAEAEGPKQRLAGLSWENLRLSGGARWGDGPFDFNDVLCGYGIRTRWVDDVRVSNCVIDHVSDSGISVRDGLRPVIEGNAIDQVAQGIDVFFDCIDGRVVGNTVRGVRVVAGINVEGQNPIGHPRNTTIAGNVVEGVVTSGIDVIESVGTTVIGNTVASVSGDHPGFPGYSFGIHLFGSPGTRVAGNQVREVRGSRGGPGRPQPTGVGIDVAANSGGSEIVGNVALACSQAACSVNDTRGTAATYDVLVEGNRFDTAVALEGNATLRAGAQTRTTRIRT